MLTAGTGCSFAAMPISRNGAGCLGTLGLVALVLSVIGLRFIVEAQAAQPQRVDGSVTAYGRLSGCSLRTPIFIPCLSTLSVTSGPLAASLSFTIEPDHFTNLPDLGAQLGSQVSLVVDTATGRVLAVTLENVTYSHPYAVHPRLKYWESVATGVACLGGWVLFAFAVWIVTYRDSSDQVLPALPQQWKGLHADVLSRYRAELHGRSEASLRRWSDLPASPARIIQALFAEARARKRVPTAKEQAALVDELTRLQEFIRDDEYELVRQFQEPATRQTLSRPDLKRAEHVLNRIEDAKDDVKALTPITSVDQLASAAATLREDLRGHLASDPRGGERVSQDLIALWLVAWAAGGFVFGSFFLRVYVGSVEWWVLFYGWLIGAVVPGTFAGRWLIRFRSGLSPRRRGLGMTAAYLVVGVVAPIALEIALVTAVRQAILLFLV